MKKFIKMMALTAAAIGKSAGAAIAEPLKVGFLYLTTPGDHGWTYAHELARQEVQAHFGDKVETTFVENVPEGPDAERVVRELARQGNQVIFGTSFGYMDPMLKVSQDFPDVKFEHITGYKRSGNMATGNIRFYEGRYVQGIVAGMMTKTNKIGYIAPFPIPEAYQGLNAFAIGMREANPNAEIMVIWANTGLIRARKPTPPRSSSHRARTSWHSTPIHRPCCRRLKRLASTASARPAT